MLGKNLSDVDLRNVKNTCPTSPNYASGLIYTFSNGEYNLEVINTDPKRVY